MRWARSADARKRPFIAVGDDDDGGGRKSGNSDELQMFEQKTLRDESERA